MGCGTLPWRKAAAIPQDPDVLLSYAQQAMKEKRFHRTADLLEKFVVQYPTHPALEKAEALLVQALLEASRRDEALAEAEFYLRNFPQGTYKEDVQLFRIRALWQKAPPVERDQEITRHVLTEIDRFLRQCQRLCEEARQLRRKVVDKLAHRRFLEAEVYRNLGQIDAERIYLQVLLEEFPETVWADSARSRLEEIRN